jgi:tetratricopeptide (TPR) repeat protein
MMTRNVTTVVIMLVFFIVGAAAPAAHAKPTVFGQAMKAYNNLEYDQAQSLFLQAIASGKLSPNEMVEARQRLAKIYIAMDKPDSAVEQYRMLLISDPDFILPTGASPKLQQAFDTAQYKLAKEKKEEKSRPESEGKADSGRKKLGWTLVGVGAGAVVAGGVSYVMAIDQNSNFQDATETDDADAYRNSGRSYETLGQALFGVGAVSTGLGIYFLKTTPSKQADSGSTYFAGTSVKDGMLQMNFGMIW